MSTSLLHNQGEMFFTSNGIPLAGGFLYYYQAGTLLAAATYSDSAGSILNPNPITLNSSGRLTVPVYIGAAYNYKEVLTDSNNVTIGAWPWDNIPMAAGAPAQQTGFERLFLPWVSVTSASSPITLTQANAGNGYECDCTSGNINFNLPAAATANLASTGYYFKRIDAVVANSLTITPNGTDNIDGVNTALGIGPGMQGVYLVSDGAQWLATFFYNAMAQKAASRQAVTASSSSLSINMALGWHTSLTLNATVTSFSVTNWPASGQLGKLTLDITNGGSFNITGWPGTTKWAAGAVPTITSGTGAFDTILLTSTDGGSTFRGYVVAQNMS